jgi:hypothetical protein
MYVPHVAVSLTRRISSSRMGSGLMGNDDSQAQDQNQRTIVIIDHWHWIDALATYNLPRLLVLSTEPLHGCGEEGSTQPDISGNTRKMLFGSIQ